MKEFCVNQSKFERCLGYGSWVIITITILTFLTASIIEMNNVYEKPVIINDLVNYTMSRYDSVLLNEPNCSRYWSMEGRTNESTIFFLGLNILNFGCIGYFIYHKQQKFKFKWCEVKKK